MPENVGDDERLARVLTSSSHYSITTRLAKAAALLPDENGEKSVFRVSDLTQDEIRSFVQQHVVGKLHGAMTFKAFAARKEGLEVLGSEPPPRHADLVNWPGNSSDPVARKARHKEMALAIISEQVDFFHWET